MLDTTHTKLVLSKWSIISLLLIFASPLLSNWFNSYVNFLGTFGKYLCIFVSYVIFLWFFDWTINKIMDIP